MFINVIVACAVLTCGGDSEGVGNTSPLSYDTTSEIVEQLTDDESHAPFINGYEAERALQKKEIYELEETVDELESEVEEYEDEVKHLKDEITDLHSEESVSNIQADDKDDSGETGNRGREQHAEVAEETTPANGATFEATYYDAYCPTCGEWGGITATGDDISESIYVGGKRVIAVDPSVIPLGSTVKVTTPNETFEAKALDTGGDIVGNRVDILVESTEKAYELGRHNVTVEIIE